MYKKMISLVLIFSLLMCSVLETGVFAQSGVSDPVAMYKNLSPEAKIVLINYMENSNSELLSYHKDKVDKNYKSTAKTLRSASIASASASSEANIALSALERKLISIGLSKASRYAFMAVGASIVAACADGPFPAGDAIGAIIDAVAIPVIIANWGEIGPKWDSIISAFKDAFSSMGSSVKKKIDEGFATAALKAQGLPTEKEFKNFDYHFEAHSKEFANMPGGNGKKPDKKKYWEMAKEFLKKTGSGIKQGTDVDYSNRIVKFNPKTLEYLVYDKNTKQIITYFLPKWSTSNAKNISAWAKAAIDYFSRSIR